jgi:hypothetical protein
MGYSVMGVSKSSIIGGEKRSSEDADELPPAMSGLDFILEARSIAG